MSFSERMEHVESPEDLDRLMTEVRQKGSANWTLSTVQQRVPDHLLPVLEDHFDEDGIILQWGEGLHSKGDDRSTLRTSVAAMIRQLNADLRSARESAAREHHERLEERSARRELQVARADLAEERLPEHPELSATEVAADGEPEPTATAPLDAPATQLDRQKPKRKRRLVKRPEDLGERPPKERSEPALPAESEAESGISEPEPITSPVQPSAPSVEHKVEEELPTPDKAEDEAYASHRFEEGWCTRCGTSSEVVLRLGYRCESARSVSPKPKAPQPIAGAAGTHEIRDDWCVRCGLSRGQASHYPCN